MSSPAEDSLEALIADVLPAPGELRAFPIFPPEAGDLVFEPTSLRTDRDAIGWLLARGEAAYAEDGSGPTREVWDIVPLSGARGAKGGPAQRWENADFYALPAVFAARALKLKRKDPTDG